MSKDLEFYFDVASPPTYIAYMRLPGIVRRTGATLVYRPMLLGGVFKLTGNLEPVGVAAKRHYMLAVDLPRNARRHGIPLHFHAEAPFNSLALMRGAVAAARDGHLEIYVDAVFRGMWADARDLSKAAEVASLLRAAGLDADALMGDMQDPEIKGDLIAATESAAARGVFGSPTFFVGDEMFFGQDRLDVVEEALSG